MKNILWLVIPCYNEGEMLPVTAELLYKEMMYLLKNNYISENSRILFIDDGSTDNTWEIIKKCNSKDEIYRGIRLSHNAGQEKALFAGMMYAKGKCDCVITLDADLQDNIKVLDKFLDKFEEGCDIVYGVRNAREKDTWFKRKTAQAFYSVMKKMGTDTINNHANYRLLSKKALTALEEYKEVNLFLRGLFPLMGFKNDIVYYERDKRSRGRTKYSNKKLFSLAIEGITSFSVKPLRIISTIGFLCSMLSIFGLVYALISFFTGVAVPGWTAIVCSIWLLGGIQMLCLGILGEYVGKIYGESKRRPRYFIDEIV